MWTLLFGRTSGRIHSIYKTTDLYRNHVRVSVAFLAVGLRRDVAGAEPVRILESFELSTVTSFISVHYSELRSIYFLVRNVCVQ